MDTRIYWTVSHYAETQLVMNAVERVREYTLELPQEPQGGEEPPAHWPSHTSGIQVENLVVRYADNLQPALKGVSFDVKPSVSSLCPSEIGT
jgi:ABC-type bacteriocin/lantibiotic exporter with double-glycine peptidase domain